MSELTGGAGSLIWVVLKAALLYLTAIIGFRLGERRTLAEMSAFDFVAAVACGAIVGRVPNSSTTSYLQGAVTLVTILIAHRIISRLRYLPHFSRLVDHPPRILAAHGRIFERELKQCGLTQDDFRGLLRQKSVTDVADVELVVFEQRGKVSVVRRSQTGGSEPPLVHEILERSGRL